jgi:hypothetical protein
LNRDTVIGIVGAVILVAAMVGVFQYERTLAPGSLGGDLVLGTVTVANATGTTVITQTSEETLNVTQANMTNVTFTLKWTVDPVAQGAPASTATVSLEIVPPPGSNLTGNLTAQGTSGTIEVKTAIPNAKPTSGPITMGAGEWTAKVKFVSSDNPTTTLPVPQQEQIRWTLTGSAQAWGPAPTPPT